MKVTWYLHREILIIFLWEIQQLMWYSTSIKENVQNKLSPFGNITPCYKSRQGSHLFWIKVNLLIAIKFTHMHYQGSILQLPTLIIWSSTSWTWHFLSQMQKSQKGFVLLCSFQAMHWAAQEQDQKEILAIQQGKAIKTWETKADCPTIGFFPPADDGEYFCTVIVLTCYL